MNANHLPNLKAQLNMHLPPELYVRLKTYCASRGIRLGWFAVQSLTAALDKAEKKSKGVIQSPFDREGK